MSARLINNPRQTNRDHINAFPALQISALRKSGGFKQGQLLPCNFQHAGLSRAIRIIVDLRLEHGLKITVGHGNSITDMQVIRLTHRPTVSMDAGGTL
jgi:hypothetical protein